MCAVIPVASQRQHGTTFWAVEVTPQVTAPGAESAVYDCLVAVSGGYDFYRCLLVYEKDN